MLVDEFDDFNHELVEIKKIIDEFEKGIGMKECKRQIEPILK